MTTVLGVPIETIELDDALAGPPTDRWKGVDVLRVQDPPTEYWPDLVAAGFFPKPQVLTWRAAAASSEEEFVRRLSGKDRQNLRTARRRTVEAGLVVTVESVDPALLDAFLPLYEAGIARMRHGWAVATEHRERILDDADRYFAVCIRDGGALVGASINEQSPERDEVRARFSATVPDQRQASLSKVLYLEVAEAARGRGVTWVSLGSDPNLYGHLAKPGLFGFKNRLGFSALPSHVVDPTSGSDQADRIVGLSALTDPSFVLAYADGPDGTPQRGASLRIELFSSGAGVDTRPYLADYLDGVRQHRVGDVAI